MSDTTCERCGKQGSSSEFGYNMHEGYGWLCRRCSAELKKQKTEKENFLKELNSLKEEQKNINKVQEVRVRKEKNVNRSYNSGSSFSDYWEKFLVIMKWIFSFVWGGPYLIVKGYKKEDKFWFYTGIEFTIVLILSIIITQAIPGLTESTEPLHIFLTYLIGGLLLINIIALVVYWVKYREEY